MQTHKQEEDLDLFYVAAESFPQGVEAAFKKLEALLPSVEGRTFFGISNMNRNGGIDYKAAVLETFDGEAEQYGCSTFVFKKGTYLTVTIHDWCNNKEQIGPAFQAMLADPRLDRTSSCIEWYRSDDELQLLVKIIDN